jgi:DNA-binding GntR family transcriptional regulator
MPLRSIAAPLAPDSVRANLAEQAYAQLKEMIHDFALLPGDRFSEIESKSGWYVKPIDFDRLDQLYDLRVLLELASVARLCARSSDPPELEALKEAWLVPVEQRLTKMREVGALDEQFHATLVRAAGNAEIAKVHWDVTERIRIVRRLDFTREDRIDATYVEHAKILRAVLQRKLDQAQLLLKSHIEQSKSEVRKITLGTLHDARQRSRG